MNYEQAMEYIYQTSWMGSRLGLARMEELLARLGNPHNRIPCVHIAGTNGKGSVAAMLASVYAQAGYKTGLYTSPAISYFGERMQINGRPIPEEKIAQLAERMKAVTDAMNDPPTEYERITALAYLYFCDQQVDIAMIETGLGGLLDATNVLEHPAACVITAIGMDHTKELGDTLEKIALQKAGILKPGAPVILYPQTETVQTVLTETAARLDAPLVVASSENLTGIRFSLDGTQFQDERGISYHIPLLGTHQIRNAAVVLETIRVLNDRFPVSAPAVQEGLRNTRWPGRFEILHKAPIVLVDGAHNPQAARALAENLRTYFPGEKICFLVGVLSDKGYNTMTEELIPLADSWITITPDSDRALPAQQLTALLQEKGQDVREGESLPAALHRFLQEAPPSEILCVCGTLTILHEVRSFFKCKNRSE